MFKDYLNEALIYINPDIKDKKGLFRFFGDELEKKGLINNKKRFIRSLQEREFIGNTELVPHIAIPHTHNSCINKMFISLVIFTKRD
jgi:mannitol/fructose-specific phosphotransferase system IIA component (Ntr-type)